MPDETKRDKVTLEEPMVSRLAMTDALGQADDRQRRHHRRGVLSLTVLTRRESIKGQGHR
jgi:hypothetical protein